MDVTLPGGVNLWYLSRSGTGCNVVGSTYSSSASAGSHFVVINPALRTSSASRFGPPLDASYSEGIDWSPRHNAYLVGFGALGNFATRRLALVNESAAVTATSGTLAQSDSDYIASSATRDLIFDLNATSSNRVFQVTSLFPAPAVAAFATPPRLDGFADAAIHPATEEVWIADLTGGISRLKRLVGNAYVDGPILQGAAAQGLAWVTLPAMVVTPPQDALACPGGSAAFTVETVGTGPIGYPWHYNGVAIDPGDNPSAVTSALFIESATDANAGFYHCVVTNECGSEASAPAMLIICEADFNRDGFLDFFDFDDFVVCFEGGACPPDRSADFNGDGFADFFDYDDFVIAFEAGS